MAITLVSAMGDMDMAQLMSEDLLMRVKHWAESGNTVTNNDPSRMPAVAS